MVARSPVRHVPASLVRFACGRPLLYPVATADLPAPLRARATPGTRFTGAIFPLGLPVARRGERYAAAGLRVDLRHPEPYRVIALAVHADAGEFGVGADGRSSTPLAWRALRAAAGLVRPAAPAATVDGAGTSRFGWRFADRRAAPDLPRELAGHALLLIAPGVSTLLGFLTAEADVCGPALRRVSAPKPLAFSVPVPDSPGPSPATRLWLAAAPAGPDADPDGVTVAQVLARAGLGGRPLGAGRYAALPPETDVPGLVSTLAAAVADLRHADRLRFALHRTLSFEEEDSAVRGDPAAESGLRALLDAAAVRSALAEHRDAAFALVVPDALFRDTLAGGDGPPDPAAFRRISADGHAWLYLRRPGLPG